MLRRVMNGVAVVLMVCMAFGTHSGRAQEGQPKPESKAATTAGQAQTRAPSIYHLEFVVRELEDGKRINSRQYTLFGESQEWARLRVGSRLPIRSGENQLQYENVGINIDCKINQSESDVLLYTKFESSSIVRGPSGGPAEVPVTRQVRFEGDSPVRLGTPMVIATLDDVATNRRYEIEVTVTKMK